MERSKLKIAPQISSIDSDVTFEKMVNEIFDFQFQQSPVYSDFIHRIGNESGNLRIPYLPIELFKTNKINTENREDVIFRSSGTMATGRSMHAVYDSELYNQLSIQNFENQYGSLKNWTILALLPSYLENGDSSLVFMVESFIKNANPNSKFIGFDLKELNETLNKLSQSNTKTLLIGVSYALLDFCEIYSVSFPNLIIMETGGMKGRRSELTRKELHSELKKGFPESKIHSEYGMTELLSQAYSQDGLWFNPPHWMRAVAVDISDPFCQLDSGKRGLLAFIDLANYYSCCFIQTRDIGIVNEKGQFTVEGRMDYSDLRGCNLLYT